MDNDVRVSRFVDALIVLLEQKGKPYREFAHHVGVTMRMPICKTFQAYLSKRLVDFERVCCAGWVAFTKMATLDAELMELNCFVESNRFTSGDLKVLARPP